ncbi:MAG: DUF3800 domain-containing protein [Chloroflexota bacterium]|nr:DUF3800 domain-containing protein [Chloroflexota bacterium]
MTNEPKEKVPPHIRHSFLDEAGDMSFYGKGRTPIIGVHPGVSLSFIMGMVKFNTPLEPIRQEIRRLQDEVANDKYLKDIASILKKKTQPGGYFFHATDDTHEARKVFYEYISSLDISFEAAVGRKLPVLFARKHNNREAEFYADMLSHLLKNKLQAGDNLILNIAQRGGTTRNAVLQMGLDKAAMRFLKRKPERPIKTCIVFNVQNPRNEPLLTVADYLCWAVQRVFERGETRYYNFVLDKISRVMDLYDPSRYKNNQNYYTDKNPLTPENKISPPSY